MNYPNPTFSDSPVAEKSFPWGCLLGGCATVLLLVVVGVVATGYAGFRFIRGQVETYTSDQPVEIPVVEYSADEVAAAKKKIDDFKAALEKGEDQEPLVLTADEINAMISSEKELAGRLFVKIEEGEITGEASFPADVIPLVGKGRFFNGSVSLKASLENGVLIVTLDKAVVNGKPVPEQFMEEIRGENLAKDAYDDRETAAFLRKFESLTIEDDKIILTPAKKQKKEPDADLPADSPAKTDASPAIDESKTSNANTGKAQAEINENPDFKPTGQQP